MKKIVLFVALFFGFVMGAVAVPVKVACVGNSITFGMGVENREVNAYPVVLQRLLGENFEVKNFGLSGATLLSKGHNPYIKTQQYKDALEMRPDVVVIHLGINDTDPRNYPIFQEEFIPDYLALIESFRKINPNVRVIIAKMTPISASHPRFKTGTRTWHEKIQNEIEIVAKSAKVEMIDFFEPLYHRQNLIPDAVHPNAKGAQILAQTVFSAITGDYGGVKMSPLYTNNMVLQKSGETKIFGKANKGEKITVSLIGANVEKTTNANSLGQWSVNLPLEKYGVGYKLKIKTQSDSLTFNNVAVGEVWMASGQSNMSWPVASSSTPSEAKPNSKIRLFMMSPTFPKQDSLSKNELEELNNLDYAKNSGWMVADLNEIQQFSAVAYLFAQKISQELGENVPVGIVQTSLGGAAAEGFVDRKLLENNDLLVDMVSDWKNSPMIMKWVRDVSHSSLKGDSDKLQRGYFQPSFLYESRIAPIKNYSLKGVIWYQGESNAENIEIHEKIFPLVVKSFRNAFNDDDLPFYFVQLSSLNRPSWGRMRDSQRKLANQINNCEMVVSYDVGDTNDVHPTDKKTVAHRLANVALANAYNKQNVGWIAPQPIKIKGKIIEFENTETLKTSDNKQIRGFEVAGKDMVFKTVTATCNKNKVVLIYDDEIYAVKYAAKPFSDANLVSKYGIPIPTFYLEIE